MHHSMCIHSHAIPVAVVWSRPDGDEAVIEHDFVSIHHELMRSSNEIDLVRLIECLGDIATKQVPSASRNDVWGGLS